MTSGTAGKLGRSEKGKKRQDLKERREVNPGGLH
jgi:hypothetical protein